MKKLVTFVHGLLCEKQHLQNMEKIREFREDPEVCLFYLEEVFEDAWELRDHAKWQKKTEKLMQDLEVVDPNEAFMLVNRALGIVRTATPIIQANPKLKELIIQLLQAM